MNTISYLLKILARRTKHPTYQPCIPINAEAKVIAQDRKIDKGIEQYNQKQSFITLKDHKENFKNNPKCYW